MSKKDLLIYDRPHRWHTKLDTDHEITLPIGMREKLGLTARKYGAVMGQIDGDGCIIFTPMDRTDGVRFSLKNVLEFGGASIRHASPIIAPNGRLVVYQSGRFAMFYPRQVKWLPEYAKRLKPGTFQNFITVVDDAGQSRDFAVNEKGAILDKLADDLPSHASDLLSVRLKAPPLTKEHKKFLELMRLYPELRGLTDLPLAEIDLRLDWKKGKRQPKPLIADPDGTVTQFDIIQAVDQQIAPKMFEALENANILRRVDAHKPGVYKFRQSVEITNALVNGKPFNVTIAERRTITLKKTSRR